MQEKCTEGLRSDTGGDQIEGVALGSIEIVGRSDGCGADGERFGRKRDELLPCQRACGHACVLHELFEFSQVMTAGMEREKGEEFAFGFWGSFPGGDFCVRTGKFDPQPDGRRAQRIALILHVLNGDPAFAFEGFQNSVGQRDFAFQMYSGKLTSGEQLQDLIQRIVSGGVHRELL